ncbi:DUF1318 domain-containing protein [candidate division KSB1 bacterium]|nr:DUF1318 domain-containing protein [candidate division KSB1 bacterium]
MKNYMVALVVFFSLLFGLQCSIRAPELNVTGEKTALENQVLGTYKQLESDTWLIASSRAIGSNTNVEMPSAKKEVMEAVQNRKFNKDDVDELKREKVIGENNRGYVEVLPHEKYQTDEDFKRYVDQIVSEENRDRQIIFARIIMINEASAGADKEKVNDVLCKLNYDNSEPGTMIQTEEGEWIEKPESEK